MLHRAASPRPHFTVQRKVQRHMPNKGKTPGFHGLLVSPPLDEERGREIERELLAPQILEELAKHPRAVAVRKLIPEGQVFLMLAKDWPRRTAGLRDDLRSKLERYRDSGLTYLQGRRLEGSDLEILVEGESGRGPVVDLLGAVQRLLKHIHEIPEGMLPALDDAMAAGWNACELQLREAQQAAPLAASTKRKDRAALEGAVLYGAYCRLLCGDTDLNPNMCEIRLKNTDDSDADDALYESAKEALARGGEPEHEEVLRLLKRCRDKRPGTIRKVLANRLNNPAQ